MDSKTCSRCKAEKPLTDFKACKKATSGRKSECRECYNKYMNEYYHSHKEYRDRMSQQAKDSRRRLRIEVMTHYSKGEPKCECCGETEYSFLSIDHIHKNGAEHRKQGIMSKTFYRWLRSNNYPEGYRVLCMNCNFAIGVHGSCPHQKRKAA